MQLFRKLDLLSRSPASLFVFGMLGAVYYFYFAAGNKPVDPPFMDSSALLEYEHGFSKQLDLGLADYIARRWILAPSKHAINLTDPNLEDFSQVGQSPFLDAFLGERRGGFFVELGAATGEKFSNTLFFEQFRGWTGLLIEPDPKQFHQLLQKHRKAYLVNACVSTTNTTGRMEFYSRGVISGLDQDKGQLLEVQCFPLYPLLRATGRVYVDYFSLDVEGAELPILRNIPFYALYIDVIGVEYRVLYPDHSWDKDSSVKKLSELRKFFRDLGLYKEIGILPWGSHFNERKYESKGLDVFFKRI